MYWTLTYYIKQFKHISSLNGSQSIHWIQIFRLSIRSIEVALADEKIKTKFEIKQIIGIHFYTLQFLYLTVKLDSFSKCTKTDVPKTDFHEAKWWKVSMKVVYLVQMQHDTLPKQFAAFYFADSDRMSIGNLYVLVTGFGLVCLFEALKWKCLWIHRYFALCKSFLSSFASPNSNDTNPTTKFKKLECDKR